MKAAAPGPEPGVLKTLHHAIESIRLGVTVTDVDGRIVYCNSADARMHGYDPEQLRGRRASIFAPPTHARPLPPSLIPQLRNWTRETTNIRQDGTTFPVLLRSDVVLDGQGTMIGMVTCCEDLTELHRLEHDLRRDGLVDRVSGLPKRAVFSDQLRRAYARAVPTLAPWRPTASPCSSWTLIGSS